MLADAAALKSYADRTVQLKMVSDEQVASIEQARGESPMNHPGRQDQNADGGASRKLMVRAGRNGKMSEIAAGERGSASYEKRFAQYLTSGNARAGLHLAPDSQNGISRTMALQSDDASQAGYLVASEQFAAGLLKEVDDLVFIRRHATIHTVREASTLGIRSRNTRLQTFAWSQELNVSDEDTALSYGKRSLTPHHLTGQIRISRDLVRRSVVSAEGEVRSELGRDAGEVMEDGFLAGSGAQQPLGVFTPSSDGISTNRDVNSGSTTGVTAAGLLSTKYAMKSQYRNGSRGALRWLFHRDVIANIAKLTDDQGHHCSVSEWVANKIPDCPKTRSLEFRLMRASAPRTR